MSAPTETTDPHVGVRTRAQARSAGEKVTVTEVVVMGVLLVLVLVVSFPVIFALLNSFRDYSEITRDPMGLPTAISLENYQALFQETAYGEALLNTVIITFGAVLVQLALIPLAAYGIERIGGRMGRFLYLFFIAGLMIPFMVRMIPLVRSFNELGLYGSLTGVILVHVGGGAAFGILLYCSFLKTVPLDVEEAAEMDGAGKLRTFWRIVFPMLMPVTSAFVIMQALGLWNDFFVALVFMDSSSAGTINVALQRMMGLLTSRWELIYTGAILTLVPSVLLFAAFQRFFIKGMAIGAVKG